MTLGVPYAVVDENTGERICPECGLRIAETYDGSGEAMSNNYADHYVLEHGDDEQ